MKEERIYINCPKDVYNIRYLLAPVNLEVAQREYLVVLCLNRYNRLLKSFILAAGTKKRVEYHIEDIFSQAQAYDTERIIVVHNHPFDGLAEMSNEDVESSKKIQETGKKRGIMVLDDVIIAQIGRYYSRCEHRERKNRYPPANWSAHTKESIKN